MCEVVNMELCHKCRKKKGFKLKDKGAHTARVKTCSGCKEKMPILPDWHWVKCN